MTTLFRRIVAAPALAFGLLGLVVCAVGGYVVWTVEDRLQRANDRAFALIDRGLGTGEERVRRTRERVEQSRITTTEITQAFREWATRTAEERLVIQLEIEPRTEKLAGQLRAADLWLESSADSIRDVQEVLELARSLGARVEPASLEPALDTLALVRAEVQEAEQTIAEVREFETPGLEENRAVRVLKLLARVLVTLSEAGPRLDRLSDRISEAQANSQQAQRKASSGILWAAVGCSVILAWFAAGQLGLCVWGRNCWGQGLTTGRLGDG